MKNQYIVVLITAKDKTQAKKIGQGLLKAKLAACVNIQEGLESFFWWQGKMDSGKETLLIVKTKQNIFEKLVLKVKVLHTYSNPEIIALPIVKGSSNYLKWIDESLKDK